MEIISKICTTKTPSSNRLLSVQLRLRVASARRRRRRGGAAHRLAARAPRRRSAGACALASGEAAPGDVGDGVVVVAAARRRAGRSPPPLRFPLLSPASHHLIELGKKCKTDAHEDAVDELSRCGQERQPERRRSASAVPLSETVIFATRLDTCCNRDTGHRGCWDLCPPLVSDRPEGVLVLD
jgi:hypothetical protein